MRRLYPSKTRVAQQACVVPAIHLDYCGKVSIETCSLNALLFTYCALHPLAP